MNRLSTTFVASAASVLLVAGFGTAPASAADNPRPAAPPTANACSAEPPDYFFTSVIVSNRPTNLESAYITGPGTISYNHTNTATAMASTTATVTAEAGVVFTKASAALGVTVGASYSSTGGFTYSLPVPAGMRRKMQLFQQSRKFVVTKKVFTPATCKWSTAYADSANAPRKKREDEWKLVA
jgi:hypothetical protein